MVIYKNTSVNSMIILVFGSIDFLHRMQKDWMKKKKVSLNGILLLPLPTISPSSLQYPDSSDA